MEHKRISVSLPDDIVSDIDKLSESSGVSSSVFIESVIKMYLAERRRIENYDRLRKGYAEMAEVNLSIARDFFNTDQATQDAYEDYLMGCE